MNFQKSPECPYAPFDTMPAGLTKRIANLANVLRERSKATEMVRRSFNRKDQVISELRILDIKTPEDLKTKVFDKLRVAVKGEIEVFEARNGQIMVVYDPDEWNYSER